MNSRWRRSIATAGALGVLAALPVQAVAAPGDGSPRPYRLQSGAKTLKGASSSTDGPRMDAGGTYKDEIGPGDSRYYTVKLDAKSTAHLSAVYAPKPGAKTADDDGIAIELQSADGTECASDSGTFSSETGRPFVVTAVRLIEKDGDCQDAGVYNVLVQRTSAGTSDPTPWPVELRFREEPGLKKTTSTEAPDYSGLDDEKTPAPPSAAAGTRRGGLGFGEATGISDGVWKDRVVPGETRYYRVPVDWGQSLFATADFGTTKVKDETATAFDGVGVYIYGPGYQLVGNNWSDYLATDPASAGVRTPPIRYANRYEDDDNAAACTAGWYYVAVRAESEVAKSAKGAVPFTLRLALKGEAKDGPQYAGDATKAGFGITGSDREAAEKGQTAAQVEDSDAKMNIAYAGIGAGVVLLLGLGGWMVIARRRAAAAAGGPPAPPAGGYGPPPGGPGY